MKNSTKIPKVGCIKQVHHLTSKKNFRRSRIQRAYNVVVEDFPNVVGNVDPISEANGNGPVPVTENQPIGIVVENSVRRNFRR